MWMKIMKNGLFMVIVGINNIKGEELTSPFLIS